MINKKQSYGFSLVELMVAMVIGLIVMGGAFSMHSTTRTTQKISEVQMDMVADARFAIDIISYDLRHAGGWGGTNNDSFIDCRSTDSDCAAAPTTPTGDCAAAGDPTWSYNLDRPIFGADGTNDGNPYSGTCIPGSEKYVAGTDILEIRYADSNLPTLRAGQAYIRSNFTSGSVFVGAAAPTLNAYDTSPLTKNHELHAYAYYVSNFTDADGDGIPSLRRAALVADVDGPSIQNQILISGVEDFQVQFGIDATGDDQIIDRYVDADVIADDDWDKVYAAKIWLLMRSDVTQKNVKEKEFTLAGVEKTYGSNGFRYFLVTSVVNLRNLKQQ